jgi:hypothetical protein
MRNKLLYGKIMLVSMVMAIVIGFLFPKKSYFVVREDGIKIEITKTRYISILEITPETEDLFKEESFHFGLSLTFLPLIFACGVLLLQFKGPNVKRSVRQSLHYSKSSRENIRENLHGNDNRMW